MAEFRRSESDSAIPERPGELEQPSTSEPASHGGFAGLAATVPMTLAMEVIQQALPPEERLPSAQEPLLIVNELLCRAGWDDDLREAQKRRLTWCAHFGYGTACGVGYAWVGSRMPLPALPRGALYGLIVWAAGYAVWLPGLRILPPPGRRPLGRNVALLASHLVWGISASIISERIGRR